ncbi:MAG: nucleotidyltransferase domain-containing protein [Atribacterota bacterium]|nr:nucleotidyltransferase domain-containing protein [Atribacterota bacterium]
MVFEETVRQLRTFSSLHAQYIEQTLSSIVGYYRELLLVLAIFGSYARGENRRNSDLDLLIILEKAPSLRKRLEEFEKAVEGTELLTQKLYEEDIFCEISPYILSRDEAFTFQPIYFDLCEYHMVVFDPKSIFPGLIASIKTLLQKHRAEKFSWGNFWGWKTDKFLGGTRL